MGALTKKEIQDTLFAADIENRLVVTPLLSDEQIGSGAIDLRLGTEFIISKRNQAHIFDPMNKNLMHELTLKSDKEFVDIGEKFYLHPNKVVLAGTLEYIKMPVHLVGRVCARSSYERLGLHVSSMCNPGYTGSLTLTFTNIGNTPIVLYPGIRIVQISLHKFTGNDLTGNAYNGKYNHEIGPMFSRAHEDKDLDIIKKIGGYDDQNND